MTDEALTMNGHSFHSMGLMQWLALEMSKWFLGEWHLQIRAITIIRNGYGGWDGGVH